MTGMKKTHAGSTVPMPVAICSGFSEEAIILRLRCSSAACPTKPSPSAYSRGSADIDCKGTNPGKPGMVLVCQVERAKEEVEILRKARQQRVGKRRKVFRRLQSLGHGGDFGLDPSLCFSVACGHL